MADGTGFSGRVGRCHIYLNPDCLFNQGFLFYPSPHPVSCLLTPKLMPLLLLPFFYCLLNTPTSINPPTKFQINGLAQGTSYTISYYASNQQINKSEIDSILQQIDSSLSLYKPYSIINQFNQNPHGIKIDQHLYSVAKKAIEISAATNNTFDITCKPFIQLWNNQSNAKRPPDPAQIKNIQKFVGTHHLRLTKDSLIKKNPNVQIDCDGIAQGYSVDKIAEWLKQKNIQHFLVELGGEIFACGHPPNKSAWNIAVQAYADQTYQNNSSDIMISDCAVTTSGSMSKFKKIGTKYYSHVFNPKTGNPLQTKIISVTVLAKDAMTADALDNALMVMGVAKAMNWLIKHPNVGVFIQYLDKQGAVQKISNEFFRKKLAH